jgi:hypothetical protein
MTTDLFLPQRRSWFLKINGVPAVPKTGDRGLVIDSLYEVVDAAGGLEHSREVFCRAVEVAQEEFNAARVFFECSTVGRRQYSSGLL